MSLWTLSSAPTAPALRESLNQRSCDVNAISEQEDRWFFVDSTGGLINDYLKGEKCIAFRRAEACGGMNAKQDGFVLQIVQSRLNTNSHGGDKAAGNIGGRSNKCFMLPLLVQALERVEKVVSAVVRFCSFDCGSFSGSNPMFRFERRDALIEIDGAPTDGEVRSLVSYFAVLRDNNEHKQIEGGMDRIDDGSDIAIDKWVERLPKISDDQFPFRVARIKLGDDFIGVFPLPRSDALLQDWDLGFGPYDGR
jgi:hypothetical protein